MFGNLRDKLSKTRSALKQRLDSLVKSGKPREEILDDLAEALILADVGVAATEKIIASVRERTSKTDGFPEIREALKADLVERLSRAAAAPGPAAPAGRLAVWMIVGVNGGGKTTTIAKLARRFRDEGRSVGLAGADTFRAAAQEQLAVWGERLGLDVVKGRYGGDPASVAFDAVHHALRTGQDIVLVDTAGRVHTNANLMQELEKIKRVLGREVPGAPHEILLVLDATIGQNALVQAREFLKVSGITGLALTKLDGTAKGGIVVAIADELSLPIKYVGTGEGEDDLIDFSPAAFVDALFE
ncbi:MAG: signal recognition particle-docking protein FtsY [Acidobacteriota bacterium]|nr:signal recognition particle-docking protein FtsY [Acidobacteriota bacterium]